MSETSSPLETQQPTQFPPVEQKPAIVQTPEVPTPRQATFGALEVTENLNADLVTPQEKYLYHDGFNTLKTMAAAAENNVDRMVLTNPDMVSGIVGLQPLVSMKTGEAIVLYQTARRAGIDFIQMYSLLEFGKERAYVKILVNDRAAENILRTYQKELGLTLPEKALQKNEILTYTTQLLNGTDIKRANLAHGLLSGFPLADCQQWVNEATVQPIPPLSQITNLDGRFLQVSPYSNKETKSNYSGVLETCKRSRNRLQ